MTLNAIMMTIFVGIVGFAILVCVIGDLLRPPTRRCRKNGRCRLAPPRK